MKVKTQSGTVYEIDRERRRLRRVSGPETSKRVTTEWREYLELELRLGDPLAIVWDVDGPQDGLASLVVGDAESGAPVRHCTVTSPVVEVEL